MHWDFVYGVPKSVLTDNGKQLKAKFLLKGHCTLGARARFTTTYQPNANAQTERFNRTILASTRRYTADHPKDWDQYSEDLTYAYNTKSNTSTGHLPFKLAFSRMPPKLRAAPAAYFLSRARCCSLPSCTGIL
eukprot:IDg9412t1